MSNKRDLPPVREMSINSMGITPKKAKHSASGDVIDLITPEKKPIDLTTPKKCDDVKQAAVVTNEKKTWRLMVGDRLAYFRGNKCGDMWCLSWTSVAKINGNHTKEGQAFCQW